MLPLASGCSQISSQFMSILLQPPPTPPNMFAHSSTSATTRNFLLRGAAEGNCNVDKIGTTPTGICASFPTFHDMMRMDIDDADLFLPSQKSLSSNNRSASASNITVDDNLIDELAFLQESFQAADTCGEMVDDEGFFELSVSEDDSFSEKTLTPARFSTSKMTCSSIHNTKASSISTICTKSSSTVEQIRSLEAKLTKSMQRTNMSRTVIQDDMSSRPHHLSRSSFVSHASTASLSSVGTMSSASSIPLPCPHNTSNISPKRIASTAAFLMGKRSTITPALEESRKKLKMYMEQLDMSV